EVLAEHLRRVGADRAVDEPRELGAGSVLPQAVAELEEVVCSPVRSHLLDEGGHVLVKVRLGGRLHLSLLTGFPVAARAEDDWCVASSPRLNAGDSQGRGAIHAASTLGGWRFTDRLMARSPRPVTASPAAMSPIYTKFYPKMGNCGR